MLNTVDQLLKLDIYRSTILQFTVLNGTYRGLLPPSTPHPFLLTRARGNDLRYMFVFN